MKLDKPRWPGGPAICPVANLPAFRSLKAFKAFKETNCPGGYVIAVWTCKACGMLHFYGCGHDPSGGSSGTTRTSKHVEEIAERFFKSDTAKTIEKLHE